MPTTPEPTTPEPTTPEPTTAAAVLLEAFARVPGIAASAVEGMSAEQLAVRPDADANSIAWLIWHTARGQDAQVSDVSGVEPAFTALGYVDRIGFGFDPSDMGYGHSPDEVARVRVADAAVLLEYLDSVQERTARYLRALTDEELARVVDENWDPPVTLAARLVSIVSDDLQHVGQASYLRGLLSR